MKYIIAFIAAGLVNLGLFLLMSFMVAGQQGGLKEIETIAMVDFIRLKHESAPPQPKERQLPQKPPPPKELPSMAMRQPQTTSQPKTAALPKITPSVELPFTFKNTGPYLGSYAETPGTGLGTDIVSVGEGDLIPMVRIPPQYPRRAARRGIDGAVTIAFIVTKEGSVRDPEVIDSHPPGIFDEAALRAIKRWKFKSKQVKGQLVEQRATQKIEFELAR